MRYIRLKSLTWWAGVFLITMGGLQAAIPDFGGGDSPNRLVAILTALTAALAPILGTGEAEASPAALIGMGLGLIGLRDAIQREGDAAYELSENRHAEAIQTISNLQADGNGYGVRPVDLFFGDDEDDLPEGVRDPWAEGGSRS